MVAALASTVPRGPQHVFVNRRMVRDKTIAHAIGDAYSAASIKERSPEVHLFIEMPLDAVDVNVHPTKAEVRFRDQSFLHSSVRMAVADALSRAPVPGLTFEAAAAPGLVVDVAAATADGLSHRFSQPLAAGLTRGRRGGGAGGRYRRQPPHRAGPPGTLMPLGQFRDTFIVAVDEGGIAIIDQHVAHERILFERITERLTAGAMESQRLLEPMLVEVAAEGHQALLAHAEDLARLGFEVEDFGADAVRVSACPALLSREESRARCASWPTTWSSWIAGRQSWMR